jgi:hypothetical protein
MIRIAVSYQRSAFSFTSPPGPLSIRWRGGGRLCMNLDPYETIFFIEVEVEIGSLVIHKVPQTHGLFYYPTGALARVIWERHIRDISFF